MSEEPKQYSVNIHLSQGMEILVVPIPLGQLRAVLKSNPSESAFVKSPLPVFLLWFFALVVII